MESTADRAVAIVGLGAILPDAPSATAFWKNIVGKRYSISEVPSERWSAAHYYDPDPTVPDKTYSKIGGWVRGFTFDWQRFRIPPKVAAAMDESQQWAVTIAAEALADYGYPDRSLPTENTGVIIGTAMGGELHYKTNLRVSFPEYAQALAATPDFQRLPNEVRAALLERWHEQIERGFPPITEDSMPGELANIVAGRVANVLNLRGPNFITDAACASTFAAIAAAVEMLDEGHVDAVLAGGVDRNMGASSFIKFCKIGALSATGTRPFGDGADGFVMGEGAALFLLKRLADAERAGDKIYAVIRGVGASSDGKGKGITAPNPAGQVLAISRAWQNAGLDPATATLVEAHGTSTKVGDVVEVESLTKIFGGAERGRIALGSAKSNIGHLKAGAGAAGMLKTVMALHDKVLPPTLNSEKPNPNIDFSATPFVLNHEPREWERPAGIPRRAAVSAYGFGGTNFHLVVEEHVPGMLVNERKQFVGATVEPRTGTPGVNREPLAVSGPSSVATSYGQSTTDNRQLTKPPIRGILAFGAETPVALKDALDEAFRKAEAGWTPPIALPAPEVLRAKERLVIDFGDHNELLDKIVKARKAAGFDNPQAWKALQAQGIFRGSGAAPGKVAFLFPGQGSQYINMGRELVQISPAVKAVFEEADRVMTPILGRSLTSYIFVDGEDPTAVKQAEKDLMQTAITQPAMLTLDAAIYKLLAEYGFTPDMVMGHSLGEYAALTAAGIMPFADALEAAAARGSEMTKVSMGDNGWMAAVMAPLDVVRQTLNEIDGYVVAANINSYGQAVIGGASKAVEQAIEIFTRKGFQAQRIPVSHAFHTKIVAPASGPLRQVLNRLRIAPPQLPLVANVTGEIYPTEVEAIKDLLEQQIASPVQWVKGLETLYANGVRTFVEVGPKKALKGFVDDVLGDKPEVVSLFSNHPKTGELASFNHVLCGLYAAGYAGSAALPQTKDEGRRTNDPQPAAMNDTTTVTASVSVPQTVPALRAEETIMTNGHDQSTPQSVDALGQLLVQALQSVATTQNSPTAYDRNAIPTGSVVISGTGLGLPGAEKAVMDPENAQRILRGEQFIDLIPERFRNQMLAKHVTRLVKSADGDGRFETITDPNEVIKLAARPGAFDLTEEYGVPAKLVEALDITTQLAIAAGLDALREAGIPLVQTYRKTTKGTFLPDRWMLPEALRDETGVIFASAFPGYDRLADEFERYYAWENRRAQLAELEDLSRYTQDPATLQELGRRIGALRAELERTPYEFDRRFLFRILAMGHSQFAEYIGARGPNTQVNAACASTTQAIALAEDWIRAGRCRRVLVIAADDVTGERLMEWIGAGFLASGAAATDDRVEEAALPFDRRRHGLIMGMGACGLVVESEDAVRERGMRGVVELLSSETGNSAYHGTRLDVEHIAQVMDRLVSAAERRFGIDRRAIASQTVFVSHETYTPARGGSAAAEVTALRRTFGPAADEIVMANTKGFTGHPMGVGIEDVIALKILEYGIVPPVPNLKEIDPDLGVLTLSRGGRYPVQFAIHLAAGFGSQIAMTLTRRIPGALDRIDSRPRYERWLADVSGYDRAETEVVKRVLRVQAQGAPQRPPLPSSWQYGRGPTFRANEPGAGASNGYHPAALVMPTPEPGPVLEQVIAKTSGNQTPAKPEGLKTPDVPATNGAAYANGHTTTPISAPVPIPTMAPAAIDTRAQQLPVEALVGSPLSVAVAPEQPTTDSVTEQVLAIVADKTGYPRDMLDLDLDLEADLGVDTVKQAETFAAVRAAFDIPRKDDLKLRDYPTLASVIQFVRDNRPDLAPEPTVVSSPSSVAAAPEPVTTDNRQPTTNNGQLTTDVVTEQVLAIVADKTGYPPEMLELDLDLEADLGVDTVKQAETFAAVRAAFAIPRKDDLKLRDYPTLASVIQFVRDNRPDLASPVVSSPSSVAAAPETRTTTDNQPRTTDHGQPTTDADRVPRRVPVPALRPPIDLCKPTGVALGESSRVIVMLDRAGVGRALVNRLEKRDVQVLTIDAQQPNETIEAQVQAYLAAGTVQGVYWLPALDTEPGIEELELDAWRELNRQRVKSLYLAMRALYEAISASGSFLVVATRMGGLHGYGDEGATAPLGGAVTGFAKAYKRERMDVLVKAVDFEASRKTAEPADALIAETLGDPGVVEVGYHDGLRYTVTLEERPAVDGQPGMELTKDTVFVVTGAAGGITSAIVGDLAQASAGVFYLLDLAPKPEADDPNIALFRSDKEALKRKLIDELRAAGERPTPVMVDKQILAIERAEAALRAIEAVQAAGGTAYYYCVNLLDGPAVAAVVDDVRQRYGKIDVLLHAGGIEISKALGAKPPQEFDLVFDIKADGFFSLLKAAAGLPIGATVAFSSVAGRFGNSGQTDYSAANDLLCKVISSLRGWRPATRGIVIDWTAWGGIGMATRGSIPKIMELAGIDMLPPEVGIPTIRRELTAGGFRGEIVVGQRLGILAEEFDLSGGLDLEKVELVLKERERPYLMLGQVKAAKLYGGLEVETILDPQQQPFLYDHQIDGVPVLPGVMGTEAFGELAELLAPGYHVAAIAEQFSSPFKFYRHQPRTLYLSATIRPAANGDLLAHTVLRSVTEPARPGLPERIDLHFSGVVRLTLASLQAPIVSELPSPVATGEGPGVRAIDKDAIYRVYFHGPAYQVLDRVLLDDDQAIGVIADHLPPNTCPDAAASLMAPRLIELCFQTAGIWEMERHGMLALPLAVGAVTAYRQPEHAEGARLYALVTAVDGGAAFDAQVVDEAGNVYVDLKGYRTVQIPGSVTL